MKQLIDMKKEVAVRRFYGYWLDIGRPKDYQKASMKVLPEHTPTRSAPSGSTALIGSCAEPFLTGWNMTLTNVMNL